MAEADYDPKRRTLRADESLPHVEEEPEDLAKEPTPEPSEPTDIEDAKPLNESSLVSIHSHATSDVLDEQKVSFVHIGTIAKNDENSEDSFDEQDMVYYQKDDMT